MRLSRAAVLWAAASAFFILAAAMPARANEGFRRVYLSETEAVRLQATSVEDRIVLERVVLTDEEIETVKKKQRVRMFTNTYRVYKLYKPGADTPYRYAIFLQEPGQHEYMDLMYGINPDGKIHRVDLLVYRETHGGEVEGRRFLKQFEGKTRSSKLRVNRDIVYIVGATISANSVSNAARRALEILRLRGYTP